VNFLRLRSLATPRERGWTRDCEIERVREKEVTMPMREKRSKGRVYREGIADGVSEIGKEKRIK
jgi:hypothetical protein